MKIFVRSVEILLQFDKIIWTSSIFLMKLRHCRSQAQMRKEEGLHRQQHDTTHYSDTKHNTPNNRESVLWAGSVSPRWMHESKHGADASCSPPTVVAARTLPAVGLSPSGWSPREPYRQAFPYWWACWAQARRRLLRDLEARWWRGVERKHQGTFNRFLDAEWTNTERMWGAP